MALHLLVATVWCHRLLPVLLVPLVKGSRPCLGALGSFPRKTASQAAADEQVSRATVGASRLLTQRSPLPFSPPGPFALLSSETRKAGLGHSLPGCAEGALACWTSPRLCTCPHASPGRARSLWVCCFRVSSAFSLNGSSSSYWPWAEGGGGRVEAGVGAAPLPRVQCAPALLRGSWK